MNTSDNFDCGLNTELSIYVEKLDWGSRRQTRRRTVELLAAVSLYFGGLRKEIRPRSWIHVKVSTIARPRPLFQPNVFLSRLLKFTLQCLHPAGGIPTLLREKLNAHTAPEADAGLI